MAWNRKNLEQKRLPILKGCQNATGLWVVGALVIGLAGACSSSSSSKPSPVPSQGSAVTSSLPQTGGQDPASTPVHDDSSAGAVKLTFRQQILQDLMQPEEGRKLSVGAWLERMETCLSSNERTPGDAVFCVSVLGSAEAGFAGASEDFRIQLNELLLRSARQRLAPGAHPIPIVFASSLMQTLRNTNSLSLLREDQRFELKALISGALALDVQQDPDQQLFPAERKELQRALQHELSKGMEG